jgi:hypothetical protein
MTKAPTNKTSRHRHVRERKSAINTNGKVHNRVSPALSPTLTKYVRNGMRDCPTRWRRQFGIDGFIEHAVSDESGNARYANIAATNKAVFKALKPGGIYILTDHAAVAGSGFVKQQVLAAGFVLEAQSSLLANGADPHTASVFDPSIRGRTDQFFFKFRKPR